ncbi:MAG: dihydroxyacetone kinase phosphoryl donor subunit DhaM [Peptostreptococcaceae bacterium]
MVGIVLVSHSNKLAEGAKELISQMASEVKISAAGGTDDNRIGTDPMKIMNSIEEVYSDDGVLLFYDIGSALMNAELALDMIDESISEKVNICKVSMVEGAFVAAIESSIGRSMDEILVAIEKLQIDK